MARPTMNVFDDWAESALTRSAKVAQRLRSMGARTSSTDDGPDFEDSDASDEEPLLAEEGVRLSE